MILVPQPSSTTVVNITGLIYLETGCINQRYNLVLCKITKSSKQQMVQVFEFCCLMYYFEGLFIYSQFYLCKMLLDR